MAWFSWQQAKQLDPSLNALDGFFTEPPVKVQTVTGGLTNRLAVGIFSRPCIHLATDQSCLQGFFNFSSQ